MNDQKIIEGLKAGKENAFRYVYSKTKPYVIGIMNKYNQYTKLSEDDKNDVFQESVITLWKLVSRNEFVLQSKLKTLLGGIYKKIASNYIRRKQRNTFINPGDESYSAIVRKASDIDIEIELEIEEEVSTIRNIIKVLKDNCKKLLTAFYFEEKSYSEIVSELNVYKNEESAKTAKNKCVMKVRDIYNTIND